MLVNKKQVIAYAKQKDKVCLSKAFHEALDEQVKLMLDRAYSRSRANKRHTIMPQDL